MRLFKKRPGKAQKHKPAAARHPSHWVFEPLEPRVLLSADAIGGSFDGYDDDFARDSVLHSPAELRSQLEFKLLHKLQDLNHSEFSASRITLSQPATWDLPPVDLDAFQGLMEASSLRIELIIVDSATPDAERLLQELRSDSGVQYQVHFLDGERGGVEQVGEILQQYSQIDAMHVIGHGAAGVIQLGSDTVHKDNLAQHQSSFASWRAALAPEADILFYGCDLAADSGGREFLNALADITGADIAASDDKTGSADLGADWQLEFHIGKVDAALPFAGAIEANWDHSLATIVVTSDQDTELPVGINSVSGLIAGGEPITLRQAIEAVNLDFQFGRTTVHTIAFDLEGTDYTIELNTVLPNVKAAVVIDGTTDPGYSGTPVVTLTGDSILLTLSGSDIVVRGLVMTGSGDDAIVIAGSRNIIVGNHIIENEISGIYIKGGSNNRVGGETAADRNVISGNGLYGVYIGVGAQGNKVIGNYIGISADGQTAYGNDMNGIRLAYLSTAANAQTTVISGNVISANEEGGIYLEFEAYRVDILNNLIGVAADGKTALGNGGNGITVKTGAGSPSPPVFTPSDVLIRGNTIAYNDGIGVSVENDYTYDVQIVENRIYANAGLGIDLASDGVTPNDPRDLDSGVNSLNNFPEIGSVSVVNGDIRITGTISNADTVASGPGPFPPPQQLPIKIHFYYSAIANPNGHGDAQVYIGSVTVTPSIGGNASFDEIFTTKIPDGSYITATATTERGTSEFAANVFLSVGNLINSPPTGEVAIAGSMIQGALLTASNTLIDGNGRTGPVIYQWQRNGSAISGATGESYTLTQEDVGATITVVASYTDDDGFAESVESAEYGPVANTNDDPTGSISIIGTAEQGEILTVQNTVSDLDGISTPFEYQWLRDGIAITGATGESYTLTQADVGSIISVSVTYEDDYGTTESVESEAIGPIANINDAPTGDLSIEGTAKQGETLTVQNTLVDPDGNPASFSYQWFRDGVAITDATEQSYILTQDDVGRAITVSTTYVDTYGEEETVTSLPTGPVENVNDAPVGGIGIQGDPTQNETLSVDLNFTDADGVPAQLQYQWYRDGQAIENATDATYTLTHQDVGRFITVRATYEDLQGTQESLLSEPIGRVINANDPPVGVPVINGAAIQGETLQANLSFTDEDGLNGRFVLQWYRDGVAIDGTNQISYKLTQADVGHQISVTVFYTDAQGTDEQVSSAPTAIVSNINDAPTGGLAIDGAAVEGQTLTVQNTINDLDGNPASFTYQWLRNGVAIAGATGESYALSRDDVGSVISVSTTYVDGYGTQESVTSAPTALVAHLNISPIGDLTIDGVAEQGRTLTVQNTLDDPDGNPASFHYQWLRDGEVITGATGTSYTLTQADVGGVITVRTVYVDGFGTEETITSTATAPIANINDDPTGNLIISGTARQGETLTVQNTLNDPDGNPASFSYQWLRDGEVITGATGTSYTLTQADVGGVITVRTIYVDGFGTEETITSAATAPIANINDDPTGNLTISGTARQGETLTVQNTISDPDGNPATFEYQWLRNGEVITGAMGTSYTLTQADVGSTITVRTIYLDGLDTEETVTSAATGLVANLNDAPTGSLSISGTAQQGQTLTVQNTLTDPDGNPAAFSYQWLRDGVAITGATGTNYTLTQADVGSVISVSTTYIDGQGTEESVTSTATAPVVNINDAPTGSVQIIGNLQLGSMLTANAAIADVDGLPDTLSYQWYRDGVAIEGATSVTYQISADDLGARLRVQVSYVDDYGAAETVLSMPTAEVGHINVPPAGDLIIDGLPQEDQILTASPDFTDADGISSALSYSWYRDGQLIEGATASTYRLADADVGARIHVVVSYTDDFGTLETLSSSATAPVAPVNDVPTGAVTIAGAAVEGGTLTASHSVQDADGLPQSLSWQWYRDGMAIAGATDSTYQLTADDVDSRISVSLNYVDGQGFSESVAADPTAPVGALNRPPEGQVSISGALEVGGIVVANPNITDANGISGSFTYIWQRDGEAIPGAVGSQYQLSEADSGTTLSVLVLYTDDRGFEEVVLSNLLEIPVLPDPEPQPEPEPEPELPVPEPLPVIPPPVIVDLSPPASTVEPPPAQESTTPAEQSEQSEQTEAESTELVSEEVSVVASDRGDDSRGPLFDRSGPAVDVTGFAMFGSESEIELRDRLDQLTSTLASSIEKVLYSNPVQSVFPALSESLALLNQGQYSKDIAQAVQSIKDTRPNLSAAIVGGTAAVSTGLSVGYVIWTLRSGILMTGLLSSLPAWRFIDPLPILSGRVNVDDEDEESLESLVAENPLPQERSGAH